jgi:hypothetical protein
VFKVHENKANVISEKGFWKEKPGVMSFAGLSGILNFTGSSI